MIGILALPALSYTLNVAITNTSVSVNKRASSEGGEAGNQTDARELSARMPQNFDHTDLHLQVFARSANLSALFRCAYEVSRRVRAERHPAPLRGMQPETGSPVSSVARIRRLKMLLDARSSCQARYGSHIRCTRGPSSRIGSEDACARQRSISPATYATHAFANCCGCAFGIKSCSAIAC